MYVLASLRDIVYCYGNLFFFFFYISPENINNPSYHTLLKGKKTPNCDYYRRFVHMTDNITEPYVERLDNLVIAMFV